MTLTQNFKISYFEQKRSVLQTSCNILTECAFVFKARCPVDLVLLLNVHDHGPVHVPPVVPCKLREAIGQGPEVASDHVKCKNNARNQDFLVRGSVKKHKQL